VCTPSAHTQISALSLHDALPIFGLGFRLDRVVAVVDRRRAAVVRRSRQDRSLRFVLDGVVAGVDRRLTAARGRSGITAGLGLVRSEEHTSELQSRENLVCRLLLE